METFIKEWTLILSAMVEAVAAVLIGIAVVQGLVLLAAHSLQRGSSAWKLDDIRLRLGRWLALSLEFLLAADILRTAVAPTWEEIGKLGAIVVLRTALNYFLQREIEHVARRREIEEKEDKEKEEDQ